MTMIEYSKWWVKTREFCYGDRRNWSTGTNGSGSGSGTGTGSVVIVVVVTVCGKTCLNRKHENQNPE